MKLSPLKTETCLKIGWLEHWTHNKGNMKPQALIIFVALLIATVTSATSRRDGNTPKLFSTASSLNGSETNYLQNETESIFRNVTGELWIMNFLLQIQLSARLTRHFKSGNFCRLFEVFNQLFCYEKGDFLKWDKFALLSARLICRRKKNPWISVMWFSWFRVTLKGFSSLISEENVQGLALQKGEDSVAEQYVADVSSTKSPVKSNSVIR